MGRKAIDLTGQRFGNLTVMRKSTLKSPSGQVLWYCACDCGGNHPAVLGQVLRTGGATRCPSCVAAGRGISEQPRTHIDLYYHSNGYDGGFVVARDEESGDILAHSQWSHTPIKGDPKHYPLIKGVMNMLVSIDRLPAKHPDMSYDRWIRKCNVVVRPHGFRPREELVQLWAEVEATGKGPQLPDLDTTPRTREPAA